MRNFGDKHRTWFERDRGYPELVPTIRLWYPRRARLFTFGEPLSTATASSTSPRRAARSEVLSS